MYETNNGLRTRLYPMTQRVGSYAVSLGAWFHPKSYQKMCEQLQARHEMGVTRDEDIVRGMGALVMGVHRGQIPLDMSIIESMAEVVRPGLRRGYYDVFDPHTARVLENVVPLGTLRIVKE